MYKFIISLLMVFMAFTANVHAVDYSYVLRDDLPSNAKILTQEPGNSYSCVAEWFAGATSGTVNMTPVFEDNCGIGLHAEEDNPNCVETQYAKPHAGYYIDLRTGNEVECDFGYYCPGALSSNAQITRTDNEGICGNEANIAENGWSNTNQNGTTLGRCKCPTGTTTGAKNINGLGMGAVTAAYCSWHICQPGEKLGKENGEYKCLPCDVDNYCVGGIYDSKEEYITKSMKECPTKYFAGAGHSDAGAFRCEYTCPAGHAMQVDQGLWYDGDTDCAPCPEGSYCPGDDGEPKTYFKSTEYEENETEDLADGYLGNKSCPAGTNTFERGAKLESECGVVYNCPAGTYLDLNARDTEGKPQCLPCREDYVDEIHGYVSRYESGSYCPGGRFPDANGGEDGKVGMFECQQYQVQQLVAGGSPVDVFLPEWITDGSHSDIDSNPFAHLSVPIANASGNYTVCSCPDGFTWNGTTQTCCNPNVKNGFCCPRYKEERTHAGERTCQTCSAEAHQEGNITFPDDISRNAYYCPGSKIIIENACVPSENQYFKNKDNCPTCGTGKAGINSVPVTPTGSTVPTSCACTKEVLAQAYPDEPHESDSDLVRRWNSNSNTCELNTYRVKVYYANITQDHRVNTHGTPYDGYPYWQNTYTYYGNTDSNSSYYWNSNETIPLGYKKDGNNFTPFENAHVFTGYCRDERFCCPAGKKVKETQSNNVKHYECEACTTEETANDDACKGLLWIATDKINDVANHINPKDKSYRKSEITYYAQLQETTGNCPAGTYLSWNGNTSKCLNCPDGAYCPGSDEICGVGESCLSKTNSGALSCPADSYFGTDYGDTGAGVYGDIKMHGEGVCWDEEQQTADNNIETCPANDLRRRATKITDCKPCSELNLSGLNGINVDDWVAGGHKHSALKLEGTKDTYKHCGYYCKPGFYASKEANKDPYNCNVPCEGPVTVNGETTYNYCPGYGKHYYALSTSWYWADKFYKVTEAAGVNPELYGPGKGRYTCPAGLMSDAPTQEQLDSNKGGPRECYKDKCLEHEYLSKDSNGGYTCKPCSGNDESVSPAKYYQCLLKNDNARIDWSTPHNFGLLGSQHTFNFGVMIDGYARAAETDSEGYTRPGYALHTNGAAREQCGSKQKSDATGDRPYECYKVLDPGTYEDNFGAVTDCGSGYYCSPTVVGGIAACPAGSTSGTGRADRIYPGRPF